MTLLNRVARTGCALHDTLLTGNYCTPPPFRLKAGASLNPSALALYVFPYAFAKAGAMPTTPDEDRAYYVALSLAPDMGPGRMHRLLRHFGTLAAAWSASPAAWRDAGLEPAVAAGLERARDEIEPARALDRVAQAGISALTWADSAFPPLLRQIPSPPILLYLRGALEARDELAVAVVGTRNATAYGRSVTRRLAADLAASGVTVVSGLARGIDAAAVDSVVAHERSARAEPFGDGEFLPA